MPALPRDPYDDKLEEIAQDMAHGIEGTTPRAIEQEILARRDDWDELVVDVVWGRSASTTTKDLAARIAELKAEGKEIEKAMADLGFRIADQGGGCMVFRKDLVDASGRAPTGHFDGPYVLITHAEDCFLPVYWWEPALLGRYKDSEDEGAFETYDSIAVLVDALRSTPAARVSAIDPKDVETINRHRSRIGAQPIDLRAGWAPQEISQMADNIRRHGREANPELKRSLLENPRHPNGIPPTPAGFLDVLTSKLTQYDMAQSKREAKTGRVNIYRIGHYLQAVTRVREAIPRADLNSSDPAALERFRRAVKVTFDESLPPAKSTLKQVDAYLSTGQAPSLTRR